MKTNKQYPKTHTIFGLKCVVICQDPIQIKWWGENKQFYISIYETLSNFKKKFTINVELKTFFNAILSGEGNTLKEAQIDLMCKLKKSTDGVQWLRFDMEDKCAFPMPYK